MQPRLGGHNGVIRGAWWVKTYKFLMYRYKNLIISVLSEILSEMAMK